MSETVPTGFEGFTKEQLIQEAGRLTRRKSTNTIRAEALIAHVLEGHRQNGTFMPSGKIVYWHCSCGIKAWEVANREEAEMLGRRHLAEEIVHALDLGGQHVETLTTYPVRREIAEQHLVGLWLELRDDCAKVKVSAVLGAIAVLRACRLLTEPEEKLWRLQIEKCPGHKDGPRSWCAYCGDVKPEAEDAG